MHLKQKGFQKGHGDGIIRSIYFSLSFEIYTYKRSSKVHGNVYHEGMMIALQH